MEDTVIRLPPQELPTEVSLGKADRNVRFTPRELELIKERFGRSLSQLIDDDDTDDKLVVLAWLKLRRAGFLVDFEQMRDVVVELTGDTPPDPLSGATSGTSPPSATSTE